MDCRGELAPFQLHHKLCSHSTLFSASLYHSKDKFYTGWNLSKDLKFWEVLLVNELWLKTTLNYTVLLIIFLQILFIKENLFYSDCIILNILLILKILHKPKVITLIVALQLCLKLFVKRRLTEHIVRLKIYSLSYLPTADWHRHDKLLFTCFFVHNTHRIICAACIFTNSDATFRDQISASRSRAE